ncbi:MAG: hypothetical protein ACLQIQ_02930 [Beijerinckiaceae bacterium]
MSNFIRFLAFGAALAIGGAANAAELSPREIVTELYRLELGPKGDMSVGPLHDFRDPLIQHRLTRDLQRLVSKMDAFERKTGDVVLDFDPVADGNGAVPLDAMVEATEPSGEKAEAVAKFHISSGEEHALTYRFARDDGAWKFDDILGKNWDLRRLIARAISAK